MAKTSKPVKFRATLDSSDGGSGWHFVTVARSVAEKFPIDGRTRRVVCTLNGVETFHCALMPSGGDFYIMVNKTIRNALCIKHGDAVAVSLIADTTRYGMPMPAELAEVLRQDAGGDKLFHELTAGMRRSLMWQVGKGKDVDLRIHRALIIVEHLKKNDGKVVSERLASELRRPLV